MRTVRFWASGSSFQLQDNRKSGLINKTATEAQQMYAWWTCKRLWWVLALQVLLFRETVSAWTKWSSWEGQASERAWRTCDKGCGVNLHYCERDRIKPPKEINEEEKTVEKKNHKLTQEKSFWKVYFHPRTRHAIVDPSCAKYRVMKSVTVPKALLAAVGTAVSMPVEGGNFVCEDAMREFSVKDLPTVTKVCMEKELILFKKKFLPQHISKTIKNCDYRKRWCALQNRQDIGKWCRFHSRVCR